MSGRAPQPERPLAHVYDAAYTGVPNWAIGDDDHTGSSLVMLSSLDAVAEREGAEDYDEWREAADGGSTAGWKENSGFSL
jgi:hypothetical protein